MKRFQPKSILKTQRVIACLSLKTTVVFDLHNQDTAVGDLGRQSIKIEAMETHTQTQKRKY